MFLSLLTVPGLTLFFASSSLLCSLAIVFILLSRAGNYFFLIHPLLLLLFALAGFSYRLVILFTASASIFCFVLYLP